MPLLYHLYSIEKGKIRAEHISEDPAVVYPFLAGQIQVAGQPAVNSAQLTSVQNAAAADATTKANAAEANAKAYADTLVSSGKQPGVIITQNTVIADNSTQRVFPVDATGGPVTITLPSSNANQHEMYHFKKIDVTANRVTILCAGSDTIDGANSYPLDYHKEAIKTWALGTGNIWFVF